MYFISLTQPFLFRNNSLCAHSEFQKRFIFAPSYAFVHSSTNHSSCSNTSNDYFTHSLVHCSTNSVRDSLSMADKESKASPDCIAIMLPHQTACWKQIVPMLSDIKENPTSDFKAFSKIYNNINKLVSPVNPSPCYLKTLLSATTVQTAPCNLIFELIPFIADLALRVDQLFPEPIPLLSQGMSRPVSVSRLQVASILANAFFNTIPEQNAKTMQTLTLIDILNVSFFASQIAKLTCILEYFRQIREHETKSDTDYLNRKITFQRRFLSIENTPNYSESAAPLLGFKSLPTGLIEDAHGCLQVDFANRFIGGGVLVTGNVQEEIRFVISPECMFSLMICEYMLPNEAIIITGAEKFSNYTGYGSGFKFEGSYIDENPVDKLNRSRTSIVCIDALEGCGGIKHQCSIIQFKRELDKSFCGFSCDESIEKVGDDIRRLPVASGNWGCGMFGGNKEVKSIIQWISASICGRELNYYTFKDVNLSEKQEAFVKLCLENGLTTGDLFNLCLEFSGKDTEETGIFEYIANKYTKMDTDTTN